MTRTPVLMSIALLSLLCAGLCTSGSCAQKRPAGATVIDDGGKPVAENKMGYIRNDAPLPAYPPYKGKRYEDRIPDTLDIAEMASLTINCLTESSDPNVDYGMRFIGAFFHNPPYLSHQFSDLCQPKFMEGLPLLRIASGDDRNSEVDRVWMESTLKSIGPDGLYYIPLKGWPWIRADYSGLWAGCVLCKPDGTTVNSGEPSHMQMTLGVSLGRMIDVMSIYYLRDKNPMWRETLNKLIDRLTELCVDEGDYAYLPVYAYEPNAKVPADAPMPKGFASFDLVGRLPEGLAKYYKVSGYEPAKKLAGKITRFMRFHSEYFDDQGRPFTGNTQVGLAGHFHAHVIGLLSMLEYATAAGDHDTIEYVRKGYEWFKTQGCDLTGFFPESVSPDDSYPSCETCEVADMISLGVKLTEAGAGDYWDDVDRWTRNQFAENQLTKVDWIKKSGEEAGKPEPVGDLAITDRVGERSLGAFAGWASANDWMDEGQAKAGLPGIMHCCTGNAARTIYYIWEHILDVENGHLKLNLLMNRASQWADVYSHIPYEGRVDLKIKKPLKDVRVRMPEWVKSEERGVACSVNGESRSFTWEGRYIRLGPAKPGDTMTVSFPIYEWTTRQRIGGKHYTLTMKGSTVVAVDPPLPDLPARKAPQDHDRLETSETIRIQRASRLVIMNSGPLHAGCLPQCRQPACTPRRDRSP